MGTTVNIPITKAGKGVVVPFDLDEVMEWPAETVRELLFQGLKNVVNRGQSKESSAKDMEGAELQAHTERVLEIVNKQIELCKEGKIRISGGKAKKASSSAVRTEAMRNARALVKDALKRAGEKVSHYPPKEITKAAELLLEGEDGPELMKQAEEAVNARQKKAAEAKIDLSAIHVDPELVKKAEAKKKKPKAGEEAQAGIAAAVAASKKGGFQAATKH